MKVDAANIFILFILVLNVTGLILRFIESSHELRTEGKYHSSTQWWLIGHCLGIAIMIDTLIQNL